MRFLSFWFGKINNCLLDRPIASVGPGKGSKLVPKSVKSWNHTIIESAGAYKVKKCSAYIPP